MGFIFPDGSSLEFQAFLTGLFLPFMAGLLGFGVASVKAILLNIKENT